MSQIKKSDIVEKNPLEYLIEDGKEADKVIGGMNAKLIELAKLSKNVLSGLKLTDTKSIQALNGEIGKMNTAYQATIKLEKDRKTVLQGVAATEAKLASDRAKELAKRQSAEQSLQKQREKGIAQMEREAKVAAEAERPYNKQSATLNRLRKDYKDLAVQGLENTKSAKGLKQQIDALDTSLKNVDKSVGQSQRFVGEYERSLGGLRKGFSAVAGVAAQFGLALGGFALAKGAIDTLVAFDNSIQDLSSVTGLAGKDLDFFKKNAIETGKTVKGGATAVVEAYKLIASAKPELLENAEALNEVTNAAVLLSKASGMELPAAATALTDAMNQFGVGSDQAGKFVDVLAAAAKFGAAEVPQVTEALLRFGAVAKTSNVSVQESAALIEDLAEKGLKGADAGTALRNVMLKLAAPDALPKEAQVRLKELGINLATVADESIPFSKRLEQLKPLLNDNAALVKVFGTENAVAATTLISTTGRIEDLTKKLDENGVALEQADARSKTISQAFNTLKETFNGFILETANSTDGVGKLTGALDFLSNNLGTIISLTGKLIVAFVTFKALSLAANTNIKELGANFFKLKKPMVDVNGELVKGKGGLTGFGSALKGIGWTVAIGLAVELATALYEVASGAAAAKAQSEALRKSIEQANANSSAEIKARRDEIDAYKQQQDLLKANGKITETEYQRRIKLRELDFQNERKIFIQQTNQSKERAKAEARRLAEFIKAQSEINALTPEEYAIRRDAIKEASVQINLLKQQIGGYNEVLKVEYGALKESAGATHDATVAEIESVKSTGIATKATKEKTKAFKDGNDEIQRLIDLQTEYQNLIDEYAKSENSANIEAGIQTQIEAIQQTGKYSIDTIKALIEEEYNLQKAIIERQALEEIDAATSEQEVINAGIKRDKALSDLEDARIARQKDVNKTLEEEQERYAEKQISDAQEVSDRQKAIDDKEKQRIKENADFRKAVINEVLDVATEASKKQEALIDQRISKEQEFNDELKQAARDGNITAQESIAESNRLIQQETLNKQKEQEEQLRLKQIELFADLIQTNLEKGDDATTATTKATTSVGIIGALAKSLPGFFKGTKTTVADELGAPDRQGRDGYLAWLHGPEKVLNEGQSLATGNATTDEIVHGFNMYKSLSEGAVMQKQPTIDVSGLREDIKGLQSAVENIETFTMDPIFQFGVLAAAQATYKKGNKTTKNIIVP